ncbi:penicillin-binding protein 1B [Methylosoma difficile]
MRYGAKKTERKPSSHWFRNIFLLLLVGCGFVLFSYLGYLDFYVREQFEGKRWAIPARVYANPVELYAGANMSAAKFEELLQILHYHKDAHLGSEGSYFKNGAQIKLKSRDFAFWDQHQPSLLMQIDFNENSIAAITDLQSSESLPIARIDPVQIGSLYPTIKEDRVLIKLEEAPDSLIKGLLASEDRDFYTHFGVSMRGIARALWANVQAGGMVQGGSTITQQLVKNFYLSSERKLTRKIKEALMAFILEFRYSKNEILEAYLNEIYLGQNGSNGVHGFGLASEFYFGSSLKELTLDQVSLLVALVRGPSEYDPRRFANRALQRRNLVLTEMAAEGYISPQDAEAAKAKPINIIPKAQRASNRYPGFMDLVKRQLKEEYPEEEITSEGLKIFTTLDTQTQDTLEKTVANKLLQLEKLPHAKDLESAVILTRKDSGEIAAMVSGRENAVSGFNRALDAVRPIGSLMKPFVYLTALENPKEWTITSRLNDTGVTVKGENGTDWTPKNYDHKEHGSVPLHKALAKSYNLATVNLGRKVGIGNIAKNLRSIGINKNIDLYPSLLLGATSLSPMDVAQMYQTLMDGGFSTPIKAIRGVINAKNEAVNSYPLNIKQVVDPGATFIVNTILQEVMHEGTAASVYDTFPKDYGLAGKTGTTNDAKDSWFAGFSGDYLAVVWVGRDDNKPIGLTGATGALPIWTALMQQVSSQPFTLDPDQVENIKMVWVNADSGLLNRKGCGNGREYPYIEGSEPTSYSSCGSEQPDQSEPNDASEPNVIEQDKPWFDLFPE